MPDVMSIVEVEENTGTVHLAGERRRYLCHLLLLSEEVQRRNEAKHPQAGVNNWHNVYSLSRNNLHGTVVGAIERKIEEEDGEEIVGGARSTGDTKVKAEDHIQSSNHKQTYQSRPCLGFS